MQWEVVFYKSASSSTLLACASQKEAGWLGLPCPPAKAVMGLDDVLLLYPPHPTCMQAAMYFLTISVTERKLFSKSTSPFLVKLQ